GCVYLHHRGDVVLRDHRVAARAAYVGDAAEYGGWRAGRVFRQILQLRQRVDLILRGLQRDRIGDAVLPVEPIGGRNLNGTGQVDHQAVGYVGSGHADVPRARAVHIDIDRRLPGRLLNAHTGHTRDMADLRQELVGVGIGRGKIVAADLQIDRCRRAEIENLAHDIG